jgi:hemerythrin
MDVQWDPALAIGEAVIDEAHQALFAQAGRLMAALDGRADKAEVEQQLTFLATYALEHFREEEALMDRTGYPPTASHHQQHIEFMQALASLHREFELRGAGPRVTERLQRMVLDWLRDHIATLDRAFGRFVQDRRRLA